MPKFPAIEHLLKGTFLDFENKIKKNKRKGYSSLSVMNHTPKVLLAFLKFREG